jgi:magnesium-transporting ATPase (P-type)
MTDFNILSFGFLLFIWLGTTVWVYRSASAKGQHKWLWTAAMLLVWLPALVVYIPWTYWADFVGKTEGGNDVGV